MSSPSDQNISRSDWLRETDSPGSPRTGNQTWTREGLTGSQEPGGLTPQLQGVRNYAMEILSSLRSAEPPSQITGPNVSELVRADLVSPAENTSERLQHILNQNGPPGYNGPDNEPPTYTEGFPRSPSLIERMIGRQVNLSDGDIQRAIVFAENLSINNNVSIFDTFANFYALNDRVRTVQYWIEQHKSGLLIYSKLKEEYDEIIGKINKLEWIVDNEIPNHARSYSERIRYTVNEYRKEFIRLLQIAKQLHISRYDDQSRSLPPPEYDDMGTALDDGTIERDATALQAIIANGRLRQEQRY